MDKDKFDLEKNEDAFFDAVHAIGDLNISRDIKLTIYPYLRKMWNSYVALHEKYCELLDIKKKEEEK